MKVTKIRIADLKDGLVLGKDLFVENRMLMKKGSALNTRIISLLKKRNIQFAYIQSDELEHHQADVLVVPEKISESQSNFYIGNKRFNPNYVQALEDLSTEIYYGHALKDMEDILNVWDLLKKYKNNVQ